ncbi:MAG: hypothetical protein QOE37_171, partial [Microbacteriaceae bacterium]|nr:hypothetical protein [Microbacteriaceae bacterium]
RLLLAEGPEAVRAAAGAEPPAAD